MGFGDKFVKRWTEGPRTTNTKTVLLNPGKTSYRRFSLWGAQKCLSPTLEKPLAGFVPLCYADNDAKYSLDP
jgi:hypothetical protein